jgi:mRNA-degrading endonuclease toxin of MazEF toxin-antitoxin module
MKRGDVVLVRFPHPSGQRGKKRPAVVVQSDAYASTVSTVVVAEVTKKTDAEERPGLPVH